MANEYLDKNGLTYFWDKIKTYVANAVKVTGVKGNSESSYRTGNVNITKANIGLGNVDNTADANKNVAYAASAGAASTAGDAATVGGGHTVLTDVPANALFTDTVPSAGTAALLSTGTDTTNRTWTAKILHDYIESGVPTTSWSRASITDSTVTFSSGGHYTSGRHCYVQMQLSTAKTINANTVTNILSGMPAPTGSLAVLQISIGNKMENYMAQVTTGGVLRIRSAAALSSGATINITGVYTIA